jgi:siderophore synthetase component
MKGGEAMAKKEATRRVLADLVNALMAEGILSAGERWEFAGRGNGLNQEEVPIRYTLTGGDHYLLFSVKPSRIQPYVLASDGVFEVRRDPDTGREIKTGLDPVGLMERLSAIPSIESSTEFRGNVLGFIENLKLSLEHHALSFEAFAAYVGRQETAPSSLSDLEQWAAFRDRPFHPVSRSKEGWDEAAYRRYSPEFREEIRLRWMAVRRDALMSGTRGEAESPAALLLPPRERELLEEAMRLEGAGRGDYLALPVHPWQMEQILPREFAPELQERTCIPLEFEAGRFTASSSVRSLAPAAGGAHHVKLPIGMISLGAVRYLPALYMLNGEKGQRLLEKSRDKDEILAAQLSLCDEGEWWAYHPPGTDLFEDRPRHLSCLIRRYPEELLGDPNVRLIPMSALSVYGTGRSRHYFDHWLEQQQSEPTEENVSGLFREVCRTFLRLAFRLIRKGVLPEMHGQNVVLVVRSGKTDGLLLRDHDTVRLHVPWLAASGLEDPHYIVKAGRSNSLYNHSPEAFLFYFQTLAIQVNLYSIIDALARSYRIREEKLWTVLRESMEEALANAECGTEQREQIREILFSRKAWPFKQLIRPLLEQAGPAGGSMPSGSGNTVNPFRQGEPEGL